MDVLEIRTSDGLVEVSESTPVTLLVDLSGDGLDASIVAERAYVNSLLKNPDCDLFVKDGKHLLFNGETGTYHRVYLRGVGEAMTTYIDPTPVEV